MPGRRRGKVQQAVIPTSLEIFICSLIDRGLETPYDFQRHGGLSVGSTVPALARMGAAGLVRKKITATGNRTRHAYHLSAAGRKLARKGWISLLDDQAPQDIETVLRVADQASHYDAPAEVIAALLNRAADQKDRLAKQGGVPKVQALDGFDYLRTRNGLEGVRLKAESKFLRRYAKLVMKPVQHQSGKD